MNAKVRLALVLLVVLAGVLSSCFGNTQIQIGDNDGTQTIENDYDFFADPCVLWALLIVVLILALGMAAAGMGR